MDFSFSSYGAVPKEPVVGKKKRKKKVVYP